MFLSWLHQYGEPRDLQLAETEAQKALKAAESRQAPSEGFVGERANTMTIESLLALGSAIATAGSDVKLATSYLEQARDAAEKRGMKKLAAHAHLCLAERYCLKESVDLRKAQEHLSQAEGWLTNVSSLFLVKKTERTRRGIRAIGEMWIVTKAELLGDDRPGNKFRLFRESLEEWMIQRVEDERSRFPTLEQRGKVVGVTAAGYLKKKQQVDHRKPK